MTTKKTGDFGEEAVCQYLIKKGYKILERNFRTRVGEIDIIAEDKGCMVFVEVKTRKTSYFGHGYEAVDKRKRQKIINTAFIYLDDSKGKEKNRDIRFDIVEVYYYMTQDIFHVKNINHIKYAFGAPVYF